MTGFFSFFVIFQIFSNPPPASTLCFMALFGLAWMISLSSFLSSSPTREIDLENSGFKKKIIEIFKNLFFVCQFLPSRLAGSGRPANSVNVLLDGLRHVHVDDLKFYFLFSKFLFSCSLPSAHPRCRVLSTPNRSKPEHRSERFRHDGK